LFYHEEKQLAGAYLGEADESGPVTVKMERCGALTGKLVGDGGLARAGVVLTSDRPYEEGESRFEHGSIPLGTRTDQDGRFRLFGLVPGLKYSLNAWGDGRIVGSVVKDMIVKAGETKNVGDVSVSP
jgi:hypothetical protein